jgi:hypothetical protein
MKMANFDSGVKAYIIGEVTVQVHFPVDWKDNPDVSCYQCNFFSRNNGICQLTKEVSEYPQKYISSKCPLTFSGEIKEIKNESN